MALVFCVFILFVDLQTANATTSVSGEIITDTVWTKSNSPYLVEDYLRIGEDATLIIEPGVIVKFKEGYFDVYGKIIALGTEEEKIYFTSFLDDSVGEDTNNDGSATTPEVGDWIGIYFADLSSASLLENVAIKYSNNIYFDSANINLNKIDFENNDSIYLDSVDTNWNKINIENNGMVYVDDGKMKLDNSTLKDSNYSFYIDSADVKINNSIIKDNQYGLIVDSGSLDLASSTISSSYGWWSAGITSWGAQEMKIIGNSISGNNQDGIYLDSASTTISENFIYGNIGSGIYKDNDLPATISGNDIFGNSDFGIYNSLGALATVEAKNNWWGDVSGPYHEILNAEGEGDEISDGVIFEPWLSESIKIKKPAGFSSVAFIPGIQASRLYKEGSVFENQLWEPNRNDDVRKLFMDPSGKSVDVGIYTRDIIKETNSPFFTGGLGLNVYKKFSESMDKLVASSTISAWKALPYDWRFDLSDIVGGGIEGIGGNISFINQKTEGQLPYMITEIGKLAENSKNGKVTIITHSNGGLVAKALLKKLAEMKEVGESDLIDKIDRLIMVAAPELGTPQAVISMLHGEGQDLGFGWILNEEVARGLAENMIGAYNLLPSEKYFNTVLNPVVKFDSSLDKLNNWRIIYGDEISSYSRLQDFILGKEGRAKPSSDNIDIPNVLSASLCSISENNHRELDDWQIPTGIEVTRIVGWGLDTVSGVEYLAKLECAPDLSPCVPTHTLDRQPIFTSEGDETVVASSATSAVGKTYYLDIKKYNEAFKDNSSHAYIFEIQPLDDLLKNIITEHSTTTLPAHITIEKPELTDKKLRLSVHSPVSIDIYDNLGNHTGLIPNPDPNSDLELTEENIPNSYYMNFGEGKYVGFSSGSQNKIELSGTGSGIFTLKVGEYLGNTEMTSTAFVDIPVTSAMKGELSIQNMDTLPQLKIDVEGDGTFDFEIKPSEEFDPILFLEIMKKTIISFGLKKSVEKNLVNRIDNLIKMIKKGKIKQAEKKIKGFIKKFESKKKHNKKINNEEKQAILNTLNQLLNNFNL